MCSVCDGQSQRSHVRTQPSSSSNLPRTLANASGLAWVKQSSQLFPIPAGIAIPTPSLWPWMSLRDREPFNQLARVMCGWCGWRWLLVNKSMVSLSPHAISKFIHISVTLCLNYSTIGCLEPMSFQGHPVLPRMLLQRHFLIGIIVNISQMHLHLPPEDEVSRMEWAFPLAPDLAKRDSAR